MAKEAANNLVETSDYIGHHLVNLTFGWCEKTSSWGFAHHQQDLSKSLDSACDVSEMGFWAFHMDTIFMSVFLGVLVFGFFGLINRSAKKGTPGKLQNFVEFVHEFIGSAVSSGYHGTSKIVAPLAFASCLWILSWNLMDLLPVEMANFFGQAGSGINYFKILPTADLNAPLALAAVVMVLVTYFSINTHGLGGFLKELFVVPLGPLEFISFVSKHVALALRLYGNLFAGEMIFILIAIMFGQFFMSVSYTHLTLPTIVGV